MRPRTGVARVTIENAAKRNALDAEILEGLAATLPSLDARCVILTGAGGAFSAGYDIGNLTPERLADVLIHPFEAALAALDDVPVPVVADVNGHAFGGGLELATGVRPARVRARRRSWACRRRGSASSIPTPGLRRFVDAIGTARTRQLFLTAEPVDAETALGVGPRELDRRGRRVRWPRGSPRSRPCRCAATSACCAALIPPLDPALEAELEALRREAFASEDFAEGVRGFIEKRPPRWQGSLSRPIQAVASAQRHSTEDRGCWISRTAWTSSTSSACTSACGWSPDRRGRAWCSTGGRCCCCARATRSGWPTIRRSARPPPTRPCGGVSARAPRASRAAR